MYNFGAPILKSWKMSHFDKVDRYVVVSCASTVLTTCERTFAKGNGFIIPPREDDFHETGLRYYA